MKRFISALAFCSLLLILLSLFLFPPVEAKENPLLTLLNLPAPAPRNPLVAGTRGRDEKFYSKSNPPKDNAPIEELLDYWSHQSSLDQQLRYSPEPSDAVRARLVREIAKNPKLLPNYLNVFKRDAKGIDLVKEIYDRESAGGVFAKEELKAIKTWLTYNSPFFSGDLERLASGVADTDEYVTNQDELLALARVDFDRARPIIDRLNADISLKTSRALAKWAQYRHALDTGSTGDAEGYREELKKFVEDKTALPGMRDLAMDALASEKEWPGRDEWYYTLLEDETLGELKVNGTVHTGLTTLIQASPDEKYIEKMVELARSDNVTVRSAAVRNLVTVLQNGGPEVVRALVPWLEDPKWAADTQGSRQTLIYKLAEYEIPESVPGLVKLLDEKATRVISANANMAPNAIGNASVYANSIRPASNTNSSRVALNPPIDKAETEEYYPHRFFAVLGLKKQKDARAVPDLRRILPDGEIYERGTVVGAILASGGFSLAEQLEALEIAATGVREQMDGEESGNPYLSNIAYANRNAPYDPTGTAAGRKPPTAVEIRAMLAEQLMQATEISDELARGIVDRIEVLDQKDRAMAAAFRRMILKWQNSAMNILLLRDVKRGIADSDTMLRLIGQRKDLREKQAPDVSDLRTGTPTAIGIAACMLEDRPDYNTILENAAVDSRIALLACARLIRAPLPIQKVAANLNTKSELLTIAAERYLESEDSTESRSIVLARHPNEAKILGATSAFFVDGKSEATSEYLIAVYQSLGNDSLYNGWYGSGNDGDLKAVEKRLKEEVKRDGDLAGVYAYDRNYIRIYKDRAIFSWEEDDSRFRERSLTKDEFDEIKSYLTTNRADELPPFLSCGGEHCEAKQLLMLGRNGGRRVYMNGDASDFFTGLDKYFAGLRKAPATLKYALGSDIPGLEIIVASDELHAETVWKDGGDLRIAASVTAVRKKVKTDIEDIDEEIDGISNYEASEAKKEAMREKRRHEGFSWHKITDGSVSGVASQPPAVEFMSLVDGLGVSPGDEMWKARAAGFELRASREGLFKVARGKLTKLQTGDYAAPVVTPNGRWAVVTKVDATADSGQRLVRVDLLTNREYAIEIEGYGQWHASAYVPAVNKILIARDDSYGYDEHGYHEEVPEDATPRDADPEAMLLVNPATGAIQNAAAEFRPLDQQTFRPLQKAVKPGEFWAAMPDSEKNETQVGIYDARTLSFRPLLRVPRIRFNSMNMWVDETHRKVYFVYRGHLLALPLAK